MLRETRLLRSQQVFRTKNLWGYAFGKRILDVTLCLMVLPLALMLTALIALAIYLDTGGPIFFFQERVGKDGRRFRLIKFRSLSQNYDSQAGREFMQDFVRGAVGQSDGAARRRVHKPIEQTHITRIGRILRKTSLDELPQIFNVLQGSMSLIGPRPNVLWEVEAYSEWHKSRLMALPGITGLAQVRGRSCITFEDIVRSDIEYIEKQSFKLDLLILWWTVLSVIGGRGAG